MTCENGCCSFEVCEFSDTCPIFLHQNEVTWRGVYAQEYCNVNPSACERHKLRVVGITPPLDLLPDGTTHVRSVYEKDW